MGAYDDLKKMESIKTSYYGGLGIYDSLRSHG